MTKILAVPQNDWETSSLARFSESRWLTDDVRAHEFCGNYRHKKLVQCVFWLEMKVYTRVNRLNARRCNAAQMKIWRRCVGIEDDYSKGVVGMSCVSNYRRLYPAAKTVPYPNLIIEQRANI